MLSSIIALAQISGFGQAVPPVANRVPAPVRVHGVELADDYAWLKDRNNPETIKYLEAENAYAEAVLAPLRPLADQLYGEMLGRIQQTDVSVPYRMGSFEYYTRTEEGKQYSIYARKPAAGGTEEVLLDVNALAEGQKFMSVGDFEVSPNARLLAYSTDNNGYRQYRLKIVDIETGKAVGFEAERVTGIQWAADSRTLYFTTEDPVTKRSNQVWRQAIGDPAPELVFEEKDALYNVGIGRTLDRAYLLINSSSLENNEIRTVPADRPFTKPRLIVRRQGELEYDLEHRDGTFYIRTNRDAKDFQVMSVSVRSPGLRNWKTLVPAIPGGKIEGLTLFKDHMVLRKRANGLPGLTVYRLDTMKRTDVPVPDEIYAIWGSANEEFASDKFRYVYSSPITPASTFEVNLDTMATTLLKRQPVLGGFDPSLYATERVWATAPDGTRVPIGLTYRKDKRRPGGNPLLLSAYGAYGASASFPFNGAGISLLDRGVILASAQIRGGSDMGEAWHDQGKMMLKRNTFTDFIACADHLVYEGFTTRAQLAISGGSAGGLLIGAVLNMRPDLGRAAMLYVPFVDVINTMLDETLPLTVGEFIEWGNPKIEKEFRYMLSYSPYDNMRRTEYPLMLVRTGLNDSQVLFHEPAKYVARMRATGRPSLLVFKTNMAAGHGGASGRYDALKETALDYAFLLTALGN